MNIIINKPEKTQIQLNTLLHIRFILVVVRKGVQFARSFCSADVQIDKNKHAIVRSSMIILSMRSM